MDMRVEFRTRRASQVFATAGTEYVHLAEHRERVFALIKEYQRAIGHPRRLSDTSRILRALLPCSGAYFALVESLLDRLTTGGAAPHREEHRRILIEIEKTLDGCSGSNSKPRAAELAHVLDALVLHEVVIRLRNSEDPA